MSRRAALEAWLVDHPDDRFSAYALALEERAAGELGLAAARLADLVVRHPSSGAAWLQLARTRLALGDETGARAAIDEGATALAGDPSAAKARRELLAERDAMDDS